MRNRGKSFGDIIRQNNLNPIYTVIFTERIGRAEACFAKVKRRKKQTELNFREKPI